MVLSRDPFESSYRWANRTPSRHHSAKKSERRRSSYHQRYSPFAVPGADTPQLGTRRLHGASSINPVNPVLAPNADGVGGCFGFSHVGGADGRAVVGPPVYQPPGSTTSRGDFGSNVSHLQPTTMPPNVAGSSSSQPDTSLLNVADVMRILDGHSTVGLRQPPVVESSLLVNSTPRDGFLTNVNMPAPADAYLQVPLPTKCDWANSPAINSPPELLPQQNWSPQWPKTTVGETAVPAHGTVQQGVEVKFPNVADNFNCDPASFDSNNNHPQY